MKLFNKLRNKYFTAFLSLVLLVMASIGLFNLSGNINSVDASMVKFQGEKAITITNGSFTSFSSSSGYPYKLSNYTNSGNSTPSMKAGAINIAEKEYAKNYSKYGLTEYGNPKGVGKDNYILMINTAEDSDYTYTSKEFTLSANGYYYVTVSAKTIGDSSVASVFLMQDNKIFENCLIENISSAGWTNYTFFVQTNAYESLTLKFGMQIGSQSTRASGCVLFDELHAGQISLETYANCLSSFNKDTFKAVEFRSKTAYKAYNFSGTVTEYVDEDGKQITDANGNLVPNVVNSNYFATSVSGGGVKNVNINNGAIDISTTDTYVIYKGEEEVLQPNTTYRFAINVKASQIKSGSAFVKLEEIIDQDDDKYEDFMESTTDAITAKSSNLTISSVTSNAMTNNYDEYVIYVHTGALYTSKVQFSFGIGSENSNATGAVSFKKYTIERVPYSAYSAASTGSKVGKFDIADRIKLNSSEYSNYSFDKMQSDSFDGVAYPANPTDWTKASSGNGYQLAGVVNLSNFNKVMAKYTNQINTMPTPSVLNGTLNNNVLMIYNGASSTQSYSSTSKSLSANKYYKITTFVNTHMWDANSNGATIVARTGNTVLAQATQIKTAGAWQKVVFYVNTPSNSVNLTLELSLGYGNNLSSGYAFFDNILVQESETKGEFLEIFDEITVAANGEITLDLSNPMLTSSTGRDYNIPVLYTGENLGNTTINAGVVDLTQDLKSIIANDKMEALRSLSSDNHNVLAISTALELDSYYKYTSVLSYNFESGKYYKLTFDLFTDRISQQDKDKKHDNGVLAEGVNIELTGLEDAKFGYVTSNGKWTSYEYYIGVDATATSNLVFSMGSEFTGCYGSAFLGNINLAEVEKDEFNNASAGATVLKVDTVKKADEETETKDSNSSNGFSWVYIPTIATFLAIVIAVVGVFVRRNIKFKKRVGNKRAEYDRDTTVIQNKYRRMASDARDKSVRELTKELNELVALRSEYEEKYKEALSRLRSTRLSNRDGSKHHEIIAIEREVKHISKEVARFGVQVNNYESEIEFMQTEAYLIDLEKRMMRENATARNLIRKEEAMTEEKRAKSIAKREEKHARAQEKAELKVEKWQRKQAKLEKERQEVQEQLETAKQKDEQIAKQRELVRIKVEQAKLEKEQAKAEKELKKLEQEKAGQEAERQKIEQEMVKADTDAEPVETEQSSNVETEGAEVSQSTETTENTVENTEEMVENAEQKAEEAEQKVEVEEVKEQTEDAKTSTEQTVEQQVEQTETNQQVEQAETKQEDAGESNQTESSKQD